MMDYATKTGIWSKGMENIEGISKGEKYGVASIYPFITLDGWRDVEEKSKVGWEVQRST